MSGKTSLEDRKDLREAVEAIEAGEAEVVVAAYLDRLVRSLKVQAEIVQRVERAGGKVLAVDVGQVTEGTASQWLSGTMHGMVAEYYARAAGERTAAAQARAVARGVLPSWPLRASIGTGLQAVEHHFLQINDEVDRRLHAVAPEWVDYFNENPSNLPLNLTFLTAAHYRQYVAPAIDATIEQINQIRGSVG